MSTPEHPTSDTSTPAPSVAANVEPFRPLDATRALATIAIVALHAATPYVRSDLPHLLWPVAERSPWLWQDWLFWSVRGFARGYLFLVAGLASAVVIRKVGASAFVRKRLQRIGLPLLVGTALILPVMYVVWSCGWVVRGWALPKDIVNFRFHGRGIQKELYGFAHLWFLYYLLLTSLVYAGWHAWMPKLRLPDRVRELLARSPLRAIVIAAPVAVVVGVMPEAIFDFKNGFLPRLDFLAYHLPFFIVGVWMAGNAPRPPSASRRWAVELLLAAAVLVVMMPLIRRQSWGPLETADRWLLASMVGLYGGLMASGLAGWASGTHAPTERRWQFLTRHSFWIYLWHLPFVGLVQIALYGLPVPIVLKVVLSFIAGIAGGIWMSKRLGASRLGWAWGERRQNR